MHYNKPKYERKKTYFVFQALSIVLRIKALHSWWLAMSDFPAEWDLPLGFYSIVCYYLCSSWYQVICGASSYSCITCAEHAALKSYRLYGTETVATPTEGRGWLAGCMPPKKCRPVLLCKLVTFSYEMLTKVVWLIKKLKSNLGLLFVVDVLIWCLSQHTCKKSIFIKNWEIWELYILFLLQQSRTTGC